MDRPPVPTYLWICGSCRTSNVIQNAPQRCPACEHWRDYQRGCCSNPGDPSPASGLFPGHPHLQHSHCNTEHAQHDHSIAYLGHQAQMVYSPTQRGYSDLWTCNECGTKDNPEWHTECPICGAGRPTEDSQIWSIDYTSYGRPAGSQGDRAWYCPNCGGANGSLKEFCADPDCGAARPEEDASFA